MEKQTILIVDDSNLNRKILNKALSQNYFILEASNGIEALSVLNKNNNISLVILDIMMPELNGIEVLKIMKSKTETSSIPIILITAADSNEEYAFELGAVDFIPKPFNINVVKSRVKTQIELRNLKTNFAPVNQADTSVHLELLELMLSSFTSGNKRDFSNNVRKNKSAVSKFINMLNDKHLLEIDSAFINKIDIINSICFRDIGKFFIDENILFKPSSLTEKEFEIIKTHTKITDILFDKVPMNLHIPVLNLIRDICYYHHENYDGSGYPLGLKGKSIPFVARIAAIIDCYEAIISNKPYRKAHSHKYALDFIIENKGIKFDPMLVDIFISLSSELEKIYF